VPAAALFDLGRGEDYVPRMTADWGTKACQNATAVEFPLGSVGAGTGALSGGIKGGLGTASEVLASGLTVAALVAVNSLGTVIDPATGTPWEVRLEVGGEFGADAKRPVLLPAQPAAEAGRNTTIGIVATDAGMNKAQCQKIAQMAHDGMARSIRPSHTMFDGDTIFCLATGRKNLPDTPGFFAAPKAAMLNEIGRAAADCMARAIIRAILAARSLNNMTAFRDLPARGAHL
jgi:L-aminopeptidase/D-esterase-like protein